MSERRGLNWEQQMRNFVEEGRVAEGAYPQVKSIRIEDWSTHEIREEQIVPVVLYNRGYPITLFLPTGSKPIEGWEPRTRV